MRLWIDGWKSCIIFSSAHFIPDYIKCGCLHGHSYAIHVILEGDIGEKGILFDFGEIKAAVKGIAGEMDHKIIVPTQGSLDILKTEKEIEIHFQNKRYVFPREECFLLPYPVSSAEHLAQYILDCLVRKIQMSSSVTSIKVGVDEGPGQGVWAEKSVK